MASDVGRAHLQSRDGLGMLLLTTQRDVALRCDAKQWVRLWGWEDRYRWGSTTDDGGSPISAAESRRLRRQSDA